MMDFADGLDIQPININDSHLEDSRKDDNDKREATECKETDDAKLGKSPITIFSLINLLDI